MKDLYEIWQGVSQEGREIKENYYATLIRIGVHGKSTFIVSEEDIDKGFGEGFEKLFSLDKNVPIGLVVRFVDKESEMTNKNPKHSIIINKKPENGENILVATLVRFDKIFTNDLEDYEQECVCKFDPAKITCWRRLFGLFRAIK